VGIVRGVKEAAEIPLPEKPTPNAAEGPLPGANPIPLVDATGLDEDLLTKEQPDEPALEQANEEWAELVNEDPMEILENPNFAIELSEDPVRLYLKEIGQIRLLDADSEFRLATRIEAERRVRRLYAALPSGLRRIEKLHAYYRLIAREMVDGWKTSAKCQKRLVRKICRTSA